MRVRLSIALIWAAALPLKPPSPYRFVHSLYWAHQGACAVPLWESAPKLLPQLFRVFKLFQNSGSPYYTQLKHRLLNQFVDLLTLQRLCEQPAVPWWAAPSPSSPNMLPSALSSAPSCPFWLQPASPALARNITWKARNAVKAFGFAQHCIGHQQPPAPEEAPPPPHSSAPKAPSRKHCGDCAFFLEHKRLPQTTDALYRLLLGFLRCFPNDRSRSQVWLMGPGTLLGSIRHGDLVPWDKTLSLFVNLAEWVTLLSETKSFNSARHTDENITSSCLDGQGIEVTMESDNGRSLAVRVAQLRWKTVESQPANSGKKSSEETRSCSGLFQWFHATVFKAKKEIIRIPSEVPQQPRLIVSPLIHYDEHRIYNPSFGVFIPHRVLYPLHLRPLGNIMLPAPNDPYKMLGFLYGRAALAMSDCILHTSFPDQNDIEPTPAANRMNVNIPCQRLQSPSFGWFPFIASRTPSDFVYQNKLARFLRNLIVPNTQPNSLTTTYTHIKELVFWDRRSLAQNWSVLLFVYPYLTDHLIKPYNISREREPSADTGATGINPFTHHLPENRCRAPLQCIVRKAFTLSRIWQAALYQQHHQERQCVGLRCCNFKVTGGIYRHQP